MNLLLCGEFIFTGEDRILSVVSVLKCPSYFGYGALEFEVD